MFKRPVIFTTFCGKGGSSSYVAVPEMVVLKSILDLKLQEFNENNAMMDLVLFDQAMVRTPGTSRAMTPQKNHDDPLS